MIFTALAVWVGQKKNRLRRRLTVVGTLWFKFSMTKRPNMVKLNVKTVKTDNTEESNLLEEENS